MRIQLDSTMSFRGRNARPNYLTLLAFIVVAELVGALGALVSPGFSAGAAQWYAHLVKPPWVVPQSWFAPVWVSLYFAMGLAAWLVSGERYHRARSRALIAYGLQLALNAVWAPAFFALHNIGAALFLIIALWLAIAWTVREFARVRGLAALLLVPYLAWVTFAAALNSSLWRLNPL
jgi:translocator protein